MLRNVAIPLMLAASEAEAQTDAELKAAFVAKAMDMDEDYDIPELIACTAAGCQKDQCDVVANTGLAALVGTVTDAEGALAVAQQSVADQLKEATDTDPAGPWTAANNARIAAIAAAEAVEVTAVGGLLDELNQAHEAERAAAEAYYAAKKAFEDGTQTAADLEATYNTLNTAFTAAGTGVTALKEAADAAVLAAQAALADEEQSRTWLYCELGAVPTAAQWTNQAADFEAPANYYTANTEPDSCVVAEVLGDTYAAGTTDAECDTQCQGAADCSAYSFDSAAEAAAAGTGCRQQIRPAITYYHALAGLAAETTTSKWNATRALIQAQTLITNTSMVGSATRSHTGAIKYYEGVEAKYTWLVAQRGREEAYYSAFETLAAAAQSAANAHTSNTFEMPSGQNPMHTWPSTWGTFYDSLAASPANVNRFAENYAGSAKQLAARLALRDQTAVATPGSGYRMPNGTAGNTGTTRAQQSDGWPLSSATATLNDDNRAYVTNWQTADETAMNTWIGYQLDAITAATNDAAVATPLYKWWLEARVASQAARDFNTLNVSGSGIWTSPPEVQMGSNLPCDTTAGTWSTSATVANLAACKQACLDYTTSSSTGIVSATQWNSKYLPRMEAGNFCSAYSWTNASTACQYKQVAATAVTAVVPQTLTTAATVYAVAAGSGAASDACMNLTADTTEGSAVADEIINFVKHQTDMVTALGTASAGSIYTDVTAEANLQAALETSWLQAYYYDQYWQAIDTQLLQAGGTRRDWANTYRKANSPDAPDTTNYPDWELSGCTYNQGQNDAALEQAREDLAQWNVDIALKQAHIDLLITQLNRTQQQIDELSGLVQVYVAPVAAVAASGGNPAVAEVVEVPAGELIAAQTERQADFDLYDGAVGEFSVAAAEAAKDAAALLVGARTVADLTQADPGEGSLTAAQRTTLATWEAAKAAVIAKDGEITDATTAANLADLRAEVVSTATAWGTANDTLNDEIGDVVAAALALSLAEKALADAQLACQVAAYDEYRATLDEALGTREQNLATIKAMLEALPAEPKAGEIGSRCEKALSNGTYRPQRGEETCGEGNCCGAARVWMGSGTTADAAWRTIETCQVETTETYSYQPPREPMELTMPDPVSVAFTCIEGAKTLAAAASAAAAAVYMLA